MIEQVISILIILVGLWATYFFLKTRRSIIKEFENEKLMSTKLKGSYDKDWVENVLQSVSPKNNDSENILTRYISKLHLNSELHHFHHTIYSNYKFFTDKSIEFEMLRMLQDKINEIYKSDQYTSDRISTIKRKFNRAQPSKKIHFWEK